MANVALPEEAPGAAQEADEASAYAREAADPLSDLERLVLEDDDADGETGAASGLAFKAQAKAAEDERGDSTEQEGNNPSAPSSEADRDDKGNAEEASPQAEPEPADKEADEIAADLEGLGPRAQKRILQLLKRAKDAEDALVEDRQAHAAVAAAHPPKPAEPAKPDALDAAMQAPGGRTATGSPYAEKISQLENVARLADDFPEGMETPDGKGGQKFWAPSELKNAARNAERELRGLVAQDAVWRATESTKFAEAERVALGQAQKRYPWMGDRATPERQMADTILRQAPELKRFSDWPVVLGILARGMLDWQAEQAGAGAPAAAAPSGAPGANGAGIQARPVASATTQSERRAPAAPRVGTGAASAPRTAGAAGQRGTGMQALLKAAEKGDTEAELEAIESML